MFYELRTYTLRPGTTEMYVQRFGDALPIREKYSKLGGFWRTEFGHLNQVVHIWPYEDLKQRNEAQAAARNDPSGQWPPKTDDAVVSMNSEFLLPAPFMRPLDKPQALGNIYEMRTYTFKNGSIPGVLERWGKGIAFRESLSPLVIACYSDVGQLNRWVHVWPYKDFAQRAQARASMFKPGVWPPDPYDLIISQENKLLIPAPFSPLH